MTTDYKVAEGNTSFRRVTITFFNRDWNSFIQLAEDERITYIVGQEEVCPSTGKEHIQAYIELKQPYKFRTLRNWLGTGNHYTKSNGSATQNREYCTKVESRKPGGRSFESGKAREGGQGRRSDLIGFKRALEEGKEEKDIICDDELFPVWVRYPGVYQRYKRAKITRRDRNVKPEVSFIFGESGVGKTRRVFDEHKDDVFIKDNTKWWDGYTGQRCILLDELAPNEHWRIEELLRLLDRYPYQGQCKGGYVNINSPYITITSNKSLDELYPDISREHMDALLRRIDITIKL